MTKLLSYRSSVEPLRDNLNVCSVQYRIVSIFHNAIKMYLFEAIVYFIISRFCNEIIALKLHRDHFRFHIVIYWTYRKDKVFWPFSIHRSLATHISIETLKVFTLVVSFVGFSMSSLIHQMASNLWLFVFDFNWFKKWLAENIFFIQSNDFKRVIT